LPSPGRSIGSPLINDQPLLPSGALGLAGLPFVVGLAVALRRHQLFDIERLVNRVQVTDRTAAVLKARDAGLGGPGGC
jgi:hypothetical protein